MHHQTKHLRTADPVEGVLLKTITGLEVNKRAIDQLDEGLVRIEKKVDALRTYLTIVFIVIALMTLFNTLLNAIALTKSAHAEGSRAVSSLGEHLPDAKD